MTESMFAEPTDNLVAIEVDPIDLLVYSLPITKKDLCWSCTLCQHGKTPQSACSLAANTPRNEWPGVMDEQEIFRACVYYEEVESE